MVFFSASLLLLIDEDIDEDHNCFHAFWPQTHFGKVLHKKISNDKSNGVNSIINEWTQTFRYDREKIVIGKESDVNKVSQEIAWTSLFKSLTFVIYVGNDSELKFILFLKILRASKF